jgi:hypothetical protein
MASSSTLVISELNLTINTFVVLQDFAKEVPSRRDYCHNFANQHTLTAFIVDWKHRSVDDRATEQFQFSLKLLFGCRRGIADTSVWIAFSESFKQRRCVWIITVVACELGNFLPNKRFRIIPAADDCGL